MSRFVHRIAFVFVSSVVFVALPACGGGDSGTLPDPGPSSGVTPSTRLVDLTEAQAGALCDWVAGRFGGYGQGVTCTDGMSITARQSKELCVMDYRMTSSTCPVTVGDIEQCTNMSVAEPPCAAVPTVCYALLACIPV